MKKFLVLYMGKTEDIGKQLPMPDEKTMAAGMAAWGKWMVDHADAVVYDGGPLGRTKSTNRSGVSDMRNAIGGFTIVQAESHEAAAKMFENHPHYMIFPGDHIETMEIMPIPGQ
ncbi:MAG: hypothetical protein WCI21_07745 [Alphaproteobacteria bacterium]